ncbi:MAG TPA: putative metal-binding motif-containing protein [Polyangiaceae bacterium]|nr:putative metal-binding motif-containing protein [Polyangiaceae bacterium]
MHASFRGIGLSGSLAAGALVSAFRLMATAMAVAAFAATTGCGNDGARSRFGSLPEAGTDSGRASLDGALPPPVNVPDSGIGEPGEWGGACVDDGQCDDALDCTHDACDRNLGRCHFVSDDTVCDDGAYCNGAERCIAGIGCRPGEPVACSDGTACTVDACVEATRTCTHTARDADGDGDPDGNCPDGGDCNDQSPDVSSRHVEVCGNSVDDDCDGSVDETDCAAPSYDVCATPLEVNGSGSFSLSSAAAKGDYKASCLDPTRAFRDLVVAVVVPDGAPQDVDVAVTTTSGDVALAQVEQCGDASSERSCAKGFVAPGATRVARTVLRALAPGAHALYVFSSADAHLVLTVEYRDASPEPANETCGTSSTLEPGTPVVARLAGTSVDTKSACGDSAGDLVYEFSLDAPRDVRVVATAQDLYGLPLLSLRGEPCTTDASELTCSESTSAVVFRRALSPGRYFVVVGGSGPSDVLVTLETSAPTTPPPDESCTGAPALEPSRTIDVSLDAHEDDVQFGCLDGAVDAAYALTLPRPSDVLLVESISNADFGAVSLAAPECARGQAPLACGASDTTPVRALSRNVDAGEYRVIVETEEGSPVSVTAFVRDAAPEIVVPFSDACDGAADIPPGGARLSGNTANAADDFTASCDVGGASGSPDQILHLHLDAASRVILDARGSAYPVVVDVRAGAECPGEEVPFGCSAGYVQGRSFLDLSLSAGDYWVQIDGYSSAFGSWILETFVTPR